MLLLITVFYFLLPPLFVFGDDCPPDRLDPVLSMEAKLHSDIFCGYDSTYRPVKNHSKAVDVSIRMSVKYFMFDEATNSLTVHSWFVMKWTDEYLTWNPKDYGNIDELVVKSMHIWQPGVSLLNSDRSNGFNDFIVTECVLSSTGEVTCVPEMAHSALCISHMKYWPYDVQNCTLRFGSWIQSGEQVNFKLFQKSPVLTTDVHPGPGWKIEQISYMRHPGVFDCCPNQTYPSVRFYFKIQRIDHGPAALFVVPGICLMVLTLVSMLMELKSSRRLFLQCFSVLGHFHYSVSLSYELPRHTEDTPVILLFYRDSLLMTITSIVLTIFLSRIITKAQTPPVLITRIFKIFESGVGSYVVFTEFDPSSGGNEDQENLTTPAKANSNNEWLLICNVVNSIVFIVFLLSYIILFFTKMPFINSYSDL